VFRKEGTMSVGPLEIFVIGFDGNHFRGEIAPAIKEAVDTGAIRVIDMIFALKDANGDVTIIEVEESDDPAVAQIRGLSDDLRDILTEDEARTMAELLPRNTSALVALIEHTWAKQISEAVRRAGGELLASQRISPRLVNQVSNQLEEAMAAGPSSKA
jgi:hypothetical protein